MTSVFDIPIINYHKISDQPDVGITSRKPQDFFDDLSLLADLGYRTVTFRQLALKEALPAKPLILTFDDGYKSVLENAFPVMDKFGFTGVVYIPTDYIGKFNDWDVQFGGRKFAHLSGSDLQFLHRHGFEIGSHGCSHRSLLALDDQTAKDELNESKKKIEHIINDRVYSISYPFGRFNAALLRYAVESGYRFGVASIFLFKKWRLNGLAPLAVRRLNVYRMDSANALIRKVQKQFQSALAYRDWIIQKGSLATVAWQKWFKK